MLNLPVGDINCPQFRIFACTERGLCVFRRNRPARKSLRFRRPGLLRHARFSNPSPRSPARLSFGNYIAACAGRCSKPLPAAQAVAHTGGADGFFTALWPGMGCV